MPLTSSKIWIERADIRNGFSIPLRFILPGSKINWTETELNWTELVHQSKKKKNGGREERKHIYKEMVVEKGKEKNKRIKAAGLPENIWNV